MTNEMMTRSQADGRIRGAARVASAFCWVAAAVAVAVALSGAVQALILTDASMRRSGIDPVTAFLTTSTASGEFPIASDEFPIASDEGRDSAAARGDGEDGAGRTETLVGSTVYLSGSPISSLANGVAFGGLACAAFSIAARMCAQIRRTGVAFAPERARELGRVGWLVLLAGCVPTLAHMLLERMAAAVVSSLVASGEMLSYALTASFEPGDLMLVALGILVVLLGRVFEYGCILQRQDDEML